MDIEIVTTEKNQMTNNLKTADKFPFELGKTYYYWTHNYTIKRMRVTVVKKDYVNFKNIDGFLIQLIGDDGFHARHVGIEPKRFYRKYQNIVKKLLSQLTTERNSLNKQIEHLSKNKNKFRNNMMEQEYDAVV